MSKPLNQLTANDFRAYEEVRLSGQFNMLTESKAAMQIAGLDRRTYAAGLSLTAYGSVPLYYDDIKKLAEEKLEKKIS